MKAQAGDRIRIPDRAGSAGSGEIVGVCGPERGEPPYAVCFEDGRIRLVVPGGDAVIEHRTLAELEG